MKNKYKKGAVSILGAIVLAIFIFVILKEYLHIDLQAIFINDQVINTYHQIQTSLINFWNQYLQHPVNFFWNAFLENMQKIHDGQPTIFNEVGQNLTVPLQIH
ncbi:MAG: hypothetical protein NTW62_03080 [Candidatus Nomurabacteria bacterium]|nr:hypothetical protein [Candidatus Nomurabacteria bacterium]